MLVFRNDKVDRNPGDQLGQVLAHEVVHQILTHLGGLPLPRWFEEGLCVMHAGIAYLEIDTTLQRMGAAGRLPGFDDVDSYFRSNAHRAGVAYRFGEAAVKRLDREYGMKAIHDLLHHVSQGAPFPAAFFRATGQNLSEFERELHRELTPFLPYFLYILASDPFSALFSFGALLVVIAYIRQRIRRRRELEALDASPY